MSFTLSNEVSPLDIYHYCQGVGLPVTGFVSVRGHCTWGKERLLHKTLKFILYVFCLCVINPFICRGDFSARTRFYIVRALIKSPAYNRLKLSIISVVEWPVIPCYPVSTPWLHNLSSHSSSTPFLPQPFISCDQHSVQGLEYHSCI